LGDGYYVSVKTDFYHIDFRKYFVSYRLEVSQIHPSKSGITIRIDEWVESLQIVIPIIHQCHPEFANAKRCADGDDNLNSSDGSLVHPVFHFDATAISGLIQLIELSLLLTQIATNSCTETVF